MSMQAPISGGGPPVNPPPSTPPASRLASWFFTSALVGWLIAYNVFRISGRSPRGTAWPSLLVGLGVGVVIFGVVMLVWKHYVVSGRIRPHHLDEIPPPERLDVRQRSALEALWPATAVLAVAALVVGAILAVDWYQTDGERSTTKVVLAAWDLLVGTWLMLETAELRRLHGEAVESIALAAMLTAVLAGVAFSQRMFDPAQIALIVLSGIVAAIAHFAGWRLLGSRGIPFGVIFAIVVATLSIVFPIVF